MAVAPTSPRILAARPGASVAADGTAAPGRSLQRLRQRIDLGRLGMIPIAVLMLFLDGRALILRTVPDSAVGVLRWVNVALMFAFYALILHGYLRRGRAVATTRSAAASVVAVVATFAPFPFPLLHGPAPTLGRQLAADLLLVAGTAWGVWSLRYLGRNLSIIAQARGVADRGPYRLVRHPLYTGEMVSALGLALASGAPAAFAFWLAFVAMQAYRARQEEKILLQSLPAYRDYRSRTAALIPGIL